VMLSCVEGQVGPRQSRLGERPLDSCGPLYRCAFISSSRRIPNCSPRRIGRALLAIRALVNALPRLHDSDHHEACYCADAAPRGVLRPLTARDGHRERRHGCCSSSRPRIAGCRGLVLQAGTSFKRVFRWHRLCLSSHPPLHRHRKTTELRCQPLMAPSLTGPFRLPLPRVRTTTTPAATPTAAAPPTPRTPPQPAASRAARRRGGTSAM
jgi:hypothetical protein